MDVLANFEVLFKARGLSAVHGRVFGTLLLSGAQMTQKQIARESGYSVPAVSIALDELVKLGLVKKRKKQRTFYYSADADLPKIMHDFLKTIKKDYVEPFLREIKEYPRTEPVKKFEKSMKNLDNYLSRLLEVRV